ncbi:MAG: hypothetical protein GX557_05320 [Chloroflexi bacterium]|nr:hypothetical protein [Chloroflexota bacterium]
MPISSAPPISSDQAALLAEKPERFLPLDPSYVDQLRGQPGLVIGEMAGRDSVAAILATLQDDAVSSVLPVAVYMGAEYGDWRGYARNAEHLRRAALERFGKPVLDLAWLGSPKLWRALNGRFITELVSRFGNYTPCLGCHFYLHAMRIPLALQLGSRVVIGGDREEHDGRVKINQTAAAIDAYIRLYRRFGLELVEPVRHVHDVAALDLLLGPDWPGGSPQPSCLFSGNYDRSDGSRAWSDAAIAEYVDGFVYPVLEQALVALTAGRTPDYEQLARQALASKNRSI